MRVLGADEVTCWIPYRDRDRDVPVAFFPPLDAEMVLGQLGTILNRFAQVAQGGASLVAASTECSAPRVVIVDDSEECREVLHTLLASRGVVAIEARGAREGLQLVRQHHPEVVVLDLDAEAADDHSLRGEFESASRDHHTAIVMLGRARHEFDHWPNSHVLAKPYHYAPLLHTIEQLLAR